MKTKIQKMIDSMNNKPPKVVDVTKTNYTLDNGDVFEHTFDIEDDITVEEFQELLDNAKSVIVDTLNKIDNGELD